MFDLVKPSPERTRTPMNDALDLHEITHLVPLASNDTELGIDERGWWPVVAFTDDVRPVVLEFNLN